MGANDRFVSVEDGALVSLTAIAAALRPPPALTVTEWADAHRRLPSKGASEPGQWRTSRVPFLAEIMDCLSDSHPSKRVVFVKSAQVGGTECGLNWVGWHIGTRMAPMLCVQPTLDMAERWSKQRLAPMIEDTPHLRSKIAPARQRDSGNTTLLKEYPGGVVIVAGANSASGLRSMPAARIFLDEVDAYPIELEGEGDPIKLAEARASTFSRRKIFLVSTPTIESLSRIWKEWRASDQRRYHVACPHCAHEQTLEWESLGWPEGRPLEAVYHCAGCGVGIEERYKTEMLAAGRWIAEYPERTVPGFHVNALYTPVGLGLSWGELAEESEIAKRDKSAWKTFENTKLGRVSKDPTEKLDEDELRARATRYDLRTLPPGCVLLTCAVDVQKDRLAVLVLGWGTNGRWWIVDHLERQGDPADPELWQWLDQYISAPFKNTRGFEVRIRMTAVDSGYLQDAVIDFTAPRQRRGVMATKGASTRGRPIIQKPSRIEYTPRGKQKKYGAEQWQVGTDTAKTHLFHILDSDRDKTTLDRRVAFSDQLGEAFYSQLTAEIYDPNKRKWVKVRDRNEVLDLFCLNIAAGYRNDVLGSRLRERELERLQAQLEPEMDLFSAPAPAAVQTPAPLTSARPATAIALHAADLSSSNADDDLFAPIPMH